MKNLKEQDIKERLLKNDTLFRDVHIIKQEFDILPEDKEHYGVSISFQDIQELREDFINDLLDTIVDWVYSSEKYKELRDKEIKNGKTEATAFSTVRRKAEQKFRKGSDSNLLVQGQFGELLLFHFIQKCMEAVPLLRKMRITTSSQHERFGADAIHYKIEGNKNIIILGEAKTYSSKYKFNEALEDAINSILNTYKTHREELNLYVHEDFLDQEMNDVAEAYLEKKLKNVEIHLVCIVVYNETRKLKNQTETKITKEIDKIIEERYRKFDNKKIPIEENIILNRITYIAFPIWKLDELLETFQKEL